jgi:predicted Fe-Mo cluster-binding NifX family protein
MLIELPLSSKDLDEAWLTTMDDVKVWGLIDFDEGEVKRVEFFDSREEIEEMVDYAIVAKQGEPIWPMIEENIFVLVAREGASIDEVIEGFKFKELHEASF